MVFHAGKGKNSTGTLFCGTTSGIIRIFQYPFSGPEHRDHRVHSSGIVSMVIKRDYNGSSLLFTASEDGSLFVFNIIDQEDKNNPVVLQARIRKYIELNI
jgi:hypothetical protein